MLETAIEAARRAGRIIAEQYPAKRTITVKGYRDLVTDVDTAAETLILDCIRSRFPDHAIISEEAGGNANRNDYTWLVDPLDGTTNYAHRHPVFAVSIALLEEGEPIIGVIYDPLRDHTFVAQRGEGVKLNGGLLQVSGVAGIGEALVGLDWGHSDEVRKRVLTCVNALLPRCGTIRVLGSAALALAYVAAGWLDAYFHLELKPWDSAAGTLLVIEAGGRCSTLEGKPYRVGSPGCLTTNGAMHEELLSVLHGRDA